MLHTRNIWIEEKWRRNVAHEEQKATIDQLRKESRVNSFEITGEELFQKMGYCQNSIDLDKINQFLFDMDDDPSKAALLWYLNSGYGRFQADKEYDKSHNCEEVDQQAIVKEIANESMTNQERAGRVKEYFHHHANGFNLFCMWELRN